MAPASHVPIHLRTLGILPLHFLQPFPAPFPPGDAVPAALPRLDLEYSPETRCRPGAVPVKDGRGPRSKLFRTLLELLRRRLMRISLGSATSQIPPARAKRIRMSVRLTTPTRRPEIRAPGNDEAEMLGPVGAMKGAFGDESAIAAEDGSEGVEAVAGGTTIPAEMEEAWLEVGASVAEWMDGVGGPEEAGDAGSVIHKRWDLVATSFATVYARVECGVTWKTGNESFPSYMPRVESMTVMKWMQVLRSRGKEVDLVSSFTSMLEILPMTL